MSVTITPTLNRGPIDKHARQAFGMQMMKFRNKVLGSQDTRMSNILAALDTLFTELYVTCDSSTVRTTTFSYTPNAAAQYVVDQWKAFA